MDLYGIAMHATLLLLCEDFKCLQSTVHLLCGRYFYRSKLIFMHTNGYWHRLSTKSSILLVRSLGTRRIGQLECDPYE